MTVPNFLQRTIKRNCACLSVYPPLAGRQVLRDIYEIIIRLLSYSTCKMNALFSSLHFAKIIKALLYAKKFLTVYVDY